MQETKPTPKPKKKKRRKKVDVALKGVVLTPEQFEIITAENKQK